MIMQDSHITALNLGYFVSDTSLFRKLDQIGCEFKHLEMEETASEMINVLAQSEQIKTIRTLTFCFDEQFRALPSFKSFESLESLPFGCIGDRNFTASELFHLFPTTVTSINIRRMSINYDEADKVFSSIQKLEMRCLDNNQGLDKFISNYMPNIRSLTVNKMNRMDKKVFSVPNHHFDYFEIIADYNFRSGLNSSVLLTTLKDNANLYYSCNKQRRDSLEFNTFVPSTQIPDDHNMNALQIICASTKRLLFGNGLEAHLVSSNTAL